jgi:hypothetical protein
MGILAEPAQFVRDLKLPNGFSVCELGDQWITHETPHRLASKFYKELGCKRYESIDGNGRGTFTYDLNIKWEQKGQRWAPFDLVTDFGTGEHIFNQAQVWRTLHVLTKPKGYIVFDRPAAGYPTHCFYLVQEGLIRDLADANRYDVVRLERAQTVRGELIRGVLRKRANTRFAVPQQGRYQKSLQIP